MEVTTRIWVSQVNPNGQSEIGALVLTLNPMVYGYALPLFAGLVMATPLVAARRALQLLLALGFVWLAQSLGTTAEVLKILGFESGPAGVAAIAKQGLSLEAIALVYQFSYLILPAVLPVALWIGLNRDFIETLIRPATEP